jgi:hypothetical protein
VALHPEQVEELHEGLLGQAVQPVEQDLGQVGEDLDQGDAGIVDRAVGPLRTEAAGALERLLDKVAEGPVVQVGNGKRHEFPPDSCMEYSIEPTARLARTR